MGNGYYIIYGKSASLGVNSKISKQINEFSKYFDMSLCEVETDKVSIIGKIISCFPYSKSGYNYSNCLKKIQNPKFIYIRRKIFDKDLYLFLKEIKKTYSKTIILIEIPTFPIFRDNYFHDIMHLFKSIPKMLKEFVYRYKVAKLTDRFVTFSQDSTIYNTETIKSYNGYDFHESIEHSELQKPSKSITFISVALMSNHSGFDRLIKSIYRYKVKANKYNIKYYIVGSGAIVKKYKNLVKRLHLENEVIFTGSLYGDKLDKLYFSSDIAVSSLALYKLKIYYGSFIKIGEYLSKGLPIITACEINPFNDKKYFINIDNNKKVPKLERIINEYQKILKSNAQHNLHEKIFEYGKNHISIEKAIQPIVNYINYDPKEKKL